MFGLKCAYAIVLIGDTVDYNLRQEFNKNGLKLLVIQERVWMDLVDFLSSIKKH